MLVVATPAFLALGDGSRCGSAALVPQGMCVFAECVCFGLENAFVRASMRACVRSLSGTIRDSSLASL